MFSTFLGTGAYLSRAKIRSMMEEDPDEAWDKYTEPSQMMTGVANMSTHLGLSGLGMELGYSTGLVPGVSDRLGLQESDTSVVSRSGGRSLSLENAIPALGVGADIATSVRDAARHTIGGNSEDAQEAYKDLMKSMPIVNSAAVQSAIAVGASAFD